MAEAVAAPRSAGPSTVASGFIALLGSGFAAAAALGVAVLVGRGFGADGAGIFFQAIALFTVAAGILKLGTGSGLVRGMARTRALHSGPPDSVMIWWATWPVLVLSSVVALGLYLSAPALANLLTTAGRVDQVSQVLRVLAPFIVVAAVLGVLHTAVRMMRGVLAFTVLQNILTPLGLIVMVGAAVVAGWDVLTAIAGWAALLPLWLLVTLGCLYGPIRRDLRRKRGKVSGESQRTFWRFTGGRAIGAAVEVCLEWSDVLIVAALRPLHEVGIYAVTTRAVRPGQIVDRALRVALSPRIAHYLPLADFRAATELHTRASRALVLLAWPVYITLILLGSAVAGLSASDVVLGCPVLAVMAAAFLVANLGGMLQSVMLMGGRSSWQVYEKSLVLALSVVGNLLLVPRLGIMGAAITFAVVVLTDTAVAATIVHRGIKVRLQPTQILPVGLIPIVVFGSVGLVVRALLGDEPWVLVVHLPVALSLYGTSLWLLRHRLQIEEVVTLSHWSRVRRSRTSGSEPGTDRSRTRHPAVRTKREIRGGATSIQEGEIHDRSVR